jgi:hypothetical protein
VPGGASRASSPERKEENVALRPLARPGALLALALALIAALSLLPLATPAAGAAENARIRAVHAVPDFGAVDVYVNGDKVLGGVTFFAVSDYLSVPAGSYRIQVIPAGDNIGHPSLFVINQSFTLAAGADYSLVARGSVAARNVGASLIHDENDAPAPGNARVRVAHFSPDAPAVDIFVNGEKVITNLAYRRVSSYLEVPAGAYTVGVAPTGGSPIYTVELAVEANTVYTAWANGLLAGAGARAFKVTPSVDATFKTAKVRAVHAVPDLAGSPVDVYVGGKKAVTFDFFTATDYLTLTEGTYEVKVVPQGGNPDTQAAITASVTVAGDKEYSIVARGTGGSFGATVLEDNNARPTAGKARVRVAHFSPDAPAVDIFLNGQRSPVQGLAFPTATGYLEVDPGTYEVGVAPAGGQPIYTTSLTIEAGKVYTAWANGLLAGTGAKAFKVTPTVDADYPTALVRLLHAVPDAPAVDVFVGGTLAAGGVRFGDLSGYLPLYAGEYPVEIRPAGGSAVAISGTLRVTGGKAYTAAAVGRLAGSPAASIAVFEDDQTKPAAGRSRLRVVHLSPDAPAVDVKSGADTLIDALSFGNAKSAEVAAGLRTLRVTLDEGGAEVLSGSFNLASGQATSVFVVGLAGGSGDQGLRVITASGLVGGAPAAVTRVHLPLVRR